MNNQSKLHITQLTDKKIVTREIEYKGGRIYMRARVRLLHGRK